MPTAAGPRPPGLEVWVPIHDYLSAGKGQERKCFVFEDGAEIEQWVFLFVCFSLPAEAYGESNKILSRLMITDILHCVQL